MNGQAEGLERGRQATAVSRAPYSPRPGATSGPDCPSVTPADAAAGSPRLTIDLGAVKRNYLRIAAHVRPSMAGAVVKADAYGMGAEPVTRALWEARCRSFFVAHLSEALTLRALGLDGAQFYVLNGLSPGMETACAAAGIIPVLNSLEQAVRWREATATLPERPACALQIDSGMARLGLDSTDLLHLVGDARFFNDLDIRLVLSQLACADMPLSDANSSQLGRFEAVASCLPDSLRSLANSAACFLDPRFRFDLVRPGLALFGVAPMPEASGFVEPIVTLDAPVLQLRTVSRGAGVGYGLTYQTSAPKRLAVVGLGYADGWRRCLSNRGAGYFDGVRLPIAGRISMDSTTLDVTALPEGALRPGDFLEMIGPHQSLEVVAADAGAIPNEILTGFGKRLLKRYRDAT